MIPGHATIDGTAGYFNSRKELGGWLEGVGLHCSRVGFGGYRVDDNTPVYSEALKAALLSGCNLIDTSTNYADGGSERATGKALAELIKVGVLDRNQVIVVSKVGYVQGSSLEMAEEWEAEGEPFPEMVKYQDGCWHCIHPEFLEVQIDLSLERLGVEKLDFYLLHNPEYFLMDAAKKGLSVLLPKLRDQFYDRIQRAFEFLEDQVAKGKIQAYGVSSNTFGAPVTRADSTSVSRMWDIAGSIAEARSGKPEAHHFRLIQLPLNLFESGPVAEKNTGPNNEMTALEFAFKNHIAVLANRPLNAFTRQTMVRLADYATNPNVGNLDTLLAQLGELELEFLEQIAPSLQGQKGIATADLFRWAKDLQEVKKVTLGVERWSQVEEQIQFHVTQICDHLSQTLKSDPWVGWQNRYLPKLRSVLASFRNNAGVESQKNSDQIGRKIDAYLPEEWKKESLSRKALGVLIHTPGVSCVLNGMRRPAYVPDSLGAVKLPRLSEVAVRKIYAAFV